MAPARGAPGGHHDDDGDGGGGDGGEGEDEGGTLAPTSRPLTGSLPSS